MLESFNLTWDHNHLAQASIWMFAEITRSYNDSIPVNIVLITRAITFTAVLASTAQYSGRLLLCQHYSRFKTVDPVTSVGILTRAVASPSGPC